MLKSEIAFSSDNACVREYASLNVRDSVCAFEQYPTENTEENNNSFKY